MYLLIIFLPFFGSILTGFGGRWLGYYGASIFSTFCIFISMLLSFFAFFEILVCNSLITIKIGSWIHLDLLIVNWSFLFDSLTVTMLVVVTFISFLVHFYSIGYMEEDPHFTRFMSYLSIFTFFMLILVTADNILQMFLGWEGVGIASYLLINFWFTRLFANQSALKALITNRIGDFGLSIAILLLFCNFGSLDYFIIFSISSLFEKYCLILNNWHINILDFLGFFLILGAVGKSAQLGLHVWLPDAMEGPTPVSALIHAATMVTAGVFLIIRFSPLIEFSSFTLILLIFFGSLTAFFAALTGSFQNDLKKIIAYSTCSQLGYMIFSCGLSHYNISIFHLTNHAFFKALLFLSAGSVIHALSDEQDLRRMGSFFSFLPLTYLSILIGSLALLGFPFLTGFYSKDLILEITQVYRNNNLFFFGSLACWFGNLSVFFTAFYSFRLIFLTFINNNNSSRVSLQFIHEPNTFMLFPLLILIFFSIFIGFFIKDLFIGLGSNSWNNSIFIFFNNFFLLESEFIIIFNKWIPFLLSLFGSIFAISLNTLKNVRLKFSFLAFLLNKKWYWDIFYNRFVVNNFLWFGYFISFKTLDRGFIELLGPYGVSNLFYNWSFYTKKFQNGYLIHYIFFMLISFCFLISLTFFNNFFLFFLFSYFIFNFFHIESIA